MVVFIYLVLFLPQLVIFLNYKILGGWTDGGSGFCERFDKTKSFSPSPCKRGLIMQTVD